MSPRPRATWRDVPNRMFLSAAQLEELRREAEAAGRKMWSDATRTGANVVARTQKELQHLGAQALDLAQLFPKAGPPPSQKRESIQAKVPRVSASARAARPKPVSPGTFLDPINAGARGLVDAATFGLGDKYEAAQLATQGLVSGKNWLDTYQGVGQQQEAADDYDRAHHPIARAVGGTIGTVGSIAMTGGVGAPARAIPYASRAVGNGARALMAHVGPHVAVAGAGAATGVAGQAASDAVRFATTGRVGDPGDYLDAAAGGAAGGLATTYLGPRAGAMAEAYTSEASRGARTGEFSLENAQANALGGALAGRAGDLYGQHKVDKLHFKKKGDLGEWMSGVKTYVSGQKPVDVPRRRKTTKGYTVVDSVTDADLLIESKFGPTARLSRNQTAAANEFDNYRVDWWDKSHVGKGTGGLPGLLFGQTFEDLDAE